MLHHSLARTKGARHTGRSALSYGEKSVDDTLTGRQGLHGDFLLQVGARFTHGPFLHHGERYRPATGLHGGNHVGDKRLALVYPFDNALHAGRDHDFVGNKRSFLYCADNVARFYLSRHGDGWDKIPLFRAVETGHLNPSGDKSPRHLGNFIQRTLNAVINGTHQPGAKFYRKRRPGGGDGFAWTNAGGLLIYLNRGPISAHFDDFTNEPQTADLDHVIHARMRHAGGDDQGSGDFDNCSFLPGGISHQFFPTSLKRISTPIALSIILLRRFCPNPMLP